LRSLALGIRTGFHHEINHHSTLVIVLKVYPDQIRIQPHTIPTASIALPTLKAKREIDIA
jgi:hypothetical protein